VWIQGVSEGKPDVPQGGPSAFVRHRWAIALLALAVSASIVAYPILTAPKPGPPTAPPQTAPPSPTASPTEARTVARSPAPTESPTSVPTVAPTETPTPLAPADQQVLRLHCCFTDPRSLRPQAASGSDEISIIDGIQRGLLYRDGEGNLVPSLAAALPTVSEDGLTYTYTLRQDARYSDGTPILATDIVRAARTLADPRDAFVFGYEMCYVKGAYDVLGTDFGCPEGDTPYSDPELGTFDDATIDGLLDQLGVTAPDEHTVVFQLNDRTSFWPDITAMWLLTPVHPNQTAWAEAADIVSSGPFMIDSWTHNLEIDLVPNPHWYGLAPTLQRIQISIGGDPSEALAAWERGDLDEVGVPSIDVPRVLATADYASMITRTTTLSLDHYDFATCLSKDATGNTLCPPNDAVTKGVVGGSPTQNLHFRQALTQAIDKADMIDVGFGGIGLPAYSPTMPGIPGFPTVTEDNTSFPFDPAAALVNLAIALDELGVAQPKPANVLPTSSTCDETCQHTKAWVKMLGTIKFGYNCDAGHDVRVMYLAHEWERVLGFAEAQMDVRCTDNGGFPTDRFRYAGNIYDIERRGWGAAFPHPDNQNRELFACGGRYNGSKYCNPDYDALLNRGAAAATYEDALPFYHQAEEMLVQDAPVLFLRYGQGVRLVRPWVINYIQSPLDHQNVGDAFYENIQIAAH
jgi:oligopeptide transport system substrate-binding protein